jgi:SAM-dependent methyltransferase
MVLQGPEEIITSTTILKHDNFICNEVCPPKDWDLLHTITDIENVGFAKENNVDVLDMGCQGSVVLKNCKKLGLIGKKIGIDFVEVPAEDGITNIIGDITKTGLDDQSFDVITCLSVIEHGVDGYKFFAECARLLRPDGTLSLSFDYWDPKLHTNAKPFGLPWCIFCKTDVDIMIFIAKSYGLTVMTEGTWSVDKPVIYPGYFSPCEHSYTFGFLTFTKVC